MNHAALSVLLFKSWNNVKLKGYTSNNWAIFQLQRLAPEVCSRNIRAQGLIKPEGSSAPQREKFHTDDVSQSLHNLSGNHEVSNAICSIFCFSWSIMAKFCVLLRTSSSKTWTLLLKRNMFHEYWLSSSRFTAFTFDLCDRLSFVGHS